MSKKRNKSTVLLFAGTAFLLCACQSNTAQNPAQQDSAVQESTMQESTMQESAVPESSTAQAAGTSAPSETALQLEVYAGPGTDYLMVGTTAKDTIVKAVKMESGWVEVEFDGRRGYVPQTDVPDLCTDTTLRLVDATDGEAQPYPVYEKVGTQITLFDRVAVYETPGQTGSSTLLDAGDTVTIIFPELTPIEMYAQIEFEENGAKRRCYAVVTDLLSMKHPLLNFDSVKETNAVISYNGTAYYSTSGEADGTPEHWRTAGSTPDGWMKSETFSVSGPNLGMAAPAHITAVMKSYNVNDEAMAGKFGLNLYENRQFKNASAKNAVSSDMEPIVNLLFDSEIPLVQTSSDTLELTVELQTFEDENRIVVKAGKPIESLFSDRTVALSALMASHTTLTPQQAAKEEDALLKSIYPRLEQDKTYHMELSLSDEFDETDSGYYLVVDNALDVYALPILHGATSLGIYSEDNTSQLDATWDFGAAMIQLDDTSAALVLAVLSENGFTVQRAPEAAQR